MAFWPIITLSLPPHRQQVPSIQYSQEANLKPRLKCQYPSSNYLIILIHSDWTQRKGESVYHKWLTLTYKRPLFLYELLKTLPSHNFVGRGAWPKGDPCTVRSNASWVMVTWRPPENGQTRLKTLPPATLLVGGNKGGFYPCRSI